MLAEQAIFTSARTDKGDGYQLVARSRGVSDPDARALAAWCPSHNALVDPEVVPVSVNFHGLPSGAYCVSRTTQEESEYSGRSGRRLHTHCIILSAELFRRFANNPFAVIRAAIAAGKFTRRYRPGQRLAGMRLVGRAQALHRASLNPFLEQFGVARFAVTLDAACAPAPLGIVRHASLDKIFAALVTCLPVEIRPRATFSTGLKHSLRRPFQWVVVQPDAAGQRFLESQHGLTVIDVPTLPEKLTRSLGNGWARYVEAVVRNSEWANLKSQLHTPRPELPPDGLDALGWQCLKQRTAVAARAADSLHVS